MESKTSLRKVPAYALAATAALCAVWMALPTRPGKLCGGSIRRHAAFPSRRKRGAYLCYVTLSATRTAGQKNKPDGAVIVETVLSTGAAEHPEAGLRKKLRVAGGAMGQPWAEKCSMAISSMQRRYSISAVAFEFARRFSAASFPRRSV